MAQNQSAVEGRGEDVLAQIARELVTVLRRDIRTHWTVRDDVRAKLRSSIKRLLVKHATHQTSNWPRSSSSSSRWNPWPQPWRHEHEAAIAATTESATLGSLSVQNISWHSASDLRVY